MRLIVITAALALNTGCILETEDCGPDLRLEDDRCVPTQAPPPYYPPGSRPSPGPQPPDAGAGPDAAPSPWARFDTALVVDRGGPDEAAFSPYYPGADIDGVLVEGPGLYGFGVSVVESRVHDPYGVSFATDPNAALGEPESAGLEPSLLVSLGTEGGFVGLSLDLERALRSGDVLTVYEVEEDPADDRYELYLCRDGGITNDACVSLGQGSGVTRFTVP